MNFKGWFQADEMRKPYRDYMQRMFPDMPPQVRHELGTNTVVPQLKKIAGNTSGNTSPIERSPFKQSQVRRGPVNSKEAMFGTTVPYVQPPEPEPEEDKTISYPAQGNSPYSSANELIDQDEKIQKFRSAQWPDSPEIITVNLDAFAPRTQDTIKFLRFGFADNIPVKRHQQRMGDQEELMKTRGSDEMEPVIVIKQSDGYELLEGWHRVMNYLLSGASPEEKEALMQGNMSAYEVDYDKWRPVKIKAYVGIPKQQAGAGAA